MAVAIIEDYKIDFDRIKDGYYTAYGVTDEIGAREISETIAESMRNFRVLFEETGFTFENTSKNEKNFYSYEEVYGIKKTETGYLFYLNKTSFYFFRFSDFQNEEAEKLDKLDEIIKKYYENFPVNPIAVIENFEWTIERLVAGSKIVYKNVILMTNIVGLILLTIIQHQLYHKIWIDIISGILCLIFLSVVFKVFYYKRMAKRILNSMNKVTRHARILFYSDEMEVITKERLGSSKLKYKEFYKIKKAKNGYIFYTQKYSFYFFWFSDFTKEGLENLDKILVDYYGKGKK